ncbi:hypothetical protein BRC84_00745 [Halobacteriales archaeon QS_1_68_44]|nr:MAG: hypothetical protein BRC84_00745 [Halobacteriales archaeon QS_1_68_44]
MALQIGDTLGGGIGRAFTYSGVVLMALLFVYQVLFTVAVNSLLLRYLPPEAAESSQFVLSAPIPLAVAGAGVVAGLLLGAALNLIAARALTRKPEALDSMPAELFTRRIGRATLSAVGANLFVGAAVFTGFLLLVVPGVYLAISFLFVVLIIGVEDERAIDAVWRSWALAGGNRWRLLALMVVVVVATVVGSSVGALSLVSPMADELLSLVVSAVFGVIGYGILAEAYLRLADGRDSEKGAGAPAPDADPAA